MKTEAITRLRTAQGARLREERQRVGLTLEAMGALGNVTKHTQCNYEAGRQSPGAVYLAVLRNAGADPYYVLTGDRIVQNRLLP